MSLPIKSKIVLQEYSYVVIESWNKYRKGYIPTDMLWNEVENKIGLRPGQRRMLGVEGSELSPISDQDTLSEVATKYPKQSVIIYDLKPI